MLDFEAPPVVKVEGVYNVNTNRFEERENPRMWYVTKCPFRNEEKFSKPECGTLCYRNITNKQNDPYFRESIKIQKQRVEFSDDLVQYGDSRFKTLYKDQWDKFENQQEQAEEKRKKKKEQFEKDRKSFLQRHERKVFGQLEEKLT